MKNYEITLLGCDDWTDFEMELTEKELELVQRIAERSIKESDYSCMPTLRVTEKTND